MSFEDWPGFLTASQGVECFPGSIRSEALECGRLLPLCQPPACMRGIALSAEMHASELARRKAAASGRTPKLRCEFLSTSVIQESL
jgi:hypothetical protein